MCWDVLMNNVYISAFHVEINISASIRQPEGVHIPSSHIRWLLQVQLLFLSDSVD